MPPSVVSGSFAQSYMARHAGQRSPALSLLAWTHTETHAPIDRAHELTQCAYIVWRAQRLICGQHIINQQARN